MIKVTGYLNGNAIDGEIDDHRLRGNKGKTTCPVCPTVGKQHINDTPLSVDKNLQKFNCHKCGWSGGWGDVKHDFNMEEKIYVVPDVGNQTELTLSHLQAFSKRGITQSVLIRNKVRSAKNDWFAFTYYNGDEPTKIKFKTPKDSEGKNKLMQSKDSKPWIYKYNDLVDQKEVMICEGEEEALIWEVAGFKHAASVDMGAPNENDKSVDAKLQCITNCFDVFENAEVIYLAVDNDQNGFRLEKELIRMFGAEKCKIIDFSPYKDANEYALKESTQKLLELKESAKDVKIEGIFTAEDFRKAILENYRNGQPKGTTTYFDEIDPHWKWRQGEVNIWTGYNNEGKSLCLKQLQTAKSIAEGWKHAVFSPEEMPLDEWYTDIMESYIGKSMDKDNKQFNNYANEAEVEEALGFVNKHFYSIYPDEDHSLKELLKLMSYTVRRNNIKTVTLDPYNQIEHILKNGEREDLYISRFMATLKRFALKHNVCMILVAHQKTPIVNKGENYPQPNLYNVKGGGTFGDKTDNCISIWRENRNTDFKCTLVKFISQKIKKQKLTGIPGITTLRFNRMKNRYETMLGVDPIENLKNNFIVDAKVEYYEKELTFKEVEEAFDMTPREDCPF